MIPLNQKPVRVSWVLVLLVLCVASVLGTAGADTIREVVIKVDGMFCPFCTFGIEKRLGALPETQAVRTDLAAGEAIVTLWPGAVFVEEHFADAITRAGFTHSGIALRETGSVPAAPPASQPAGPASQPAGPRSAPTGGQDDAAVAFRRTIGEPGTGVGQFDQPMSIAFAPNGWFVVTDAGNQRVQQFESDGTPWRSWQTSGDGETHLRKPVGVAVDSAGDIWVTDYDADSVNHYAMDGTPKGQFGTSGSETSALDAPSGITITSSSTIAVADFYNHRIQVYQKDGTFLQTIGVTGAMRTRSKGGLNYPTRIASGGNGMLWVADAYNHRVVAFLESGDFIREFGAHGSLAGEFDVSSGIAFIPGDRLLVADFMNHRVQMWTAGGEFLSQFGEQGDLPGEFERPTDVAVSPDGLVYVVDWGNNRVQVFDLGDVR